MLAYLKIVLPLTKYNSRVSQKLTTGFLVLMFFLSSKILTAQSGTLSGIISSDSTNVEFANVLIQKINLGAVTDSMGRYKIKIIPYGEYTVQVNLLGY